MGTRLPDGSRGLCRSCALNLKGKKEEGEQDPDRDSNGHLGRNLRDLAPILGQSGPNLDTILGRCAEDPRPKSPKNSGTTRQLRRRLEGLGVPLLGLLAGPRGTQEHRPLRAAGWKIKFCAVRGPPKSSQLSEVVENFLAGECTGDPLTAQWASKLRMGL